MERGVRARERTWRSDPGRPPAQPACHSVCWVVGLRGAASAGGRLGRGGVSAWDGGKWWTAPGCGGPEARGGPSIWAPSGGGAGCGARAGREPRSRSPQGAQARRAAGRAGLGEGGRPARVAAWWRQRTVTLMVAFLRARQPWAQGLIITFLLMRIFECGRTGST